MLSNSPAYKDGRLRKGDRILSINGLSMRGLTHRESVTVLKTPRLEVVMVVTRSESVRTAVTAGGSAAEQLAKAKRASLGSLTSLHEKSVGQQMQQQQGSGTNSGNGAGTGAGNKAEDIARRKMVYHKLSQSLDMDLDMMSNEGSWADTRSSSTALDVNWNMLFAGSSIYDENKSVDGADDSTGSSMGDDAVFGLSESGHSHQFGGVAPASLKTPEGILFEQSEPNRANRLTIISSLRSRSHC